MKSKRSALVCLGLLVLCAFGGTRFTPVAQADGETRVCLCYTTRIVDCWSKTNPPPAAETPCPDCVPEATCTGSDEYLYLMVHNCECLTEAEILLGMTGRTSCSSLFIEYCEGYMDCVATIACNERTSGTQCEHDPSSLRPKSSGAIWASKTETGNTCP